MFGESLCAKLDESKDIPNIRNRLGELGRLLEVLQRKKPAARLKDFLAPGSFSELVSGVAGPSGFDEEAHRYQTPSL